MPPGMGPSSTLASDTARELALAVVQAHEGSVGGGGGGGTHSRSMSVCSSPSATVAGAGATVASGAGLGSIMVSGSSRSRSHSRSRSASVVTELSDAELTATGAAAAHSHTHVHAHTPVDFAAIAEAEDELDHARHVRVAAGIDLQRETDLGRIPSDSVGSASPTVPLPIRRASVLGGAAAPGDRVRADVSSVAVGATAGAPPPHSPGSLFAPAVEGSRGLFGGAGGFARVTSASGAWGGGGGGGGGGAGGAGGGRLGVGGGASGSSGAAPYSAIALLDAARERPVSLHDVLLPTAVWGEAEATSFSRRRISGVSSSTNLPRPKD